jgi:hypothetical protein
LSKDLGKQIQDITSKIQDNKSGALYTQLFNGIHAFGGIGRAFDNEQKTRSLVETTLISAISSLQDVQIDMEINLNLFKHLRPDIVILERKQIGEDIGDKLSCLKGPGKMLFVVEVKKVDQKDSKSK